MRLLGAGLRPCREGSDPAGATQGSSLTLGAHVPLGGGGAHRGFVPLPTGALGETSGKHGQLSHLPGPWGPQGPRP